MLLEDGEVDPRVRTRARRRFAATGALSTIGLLVGGYGMTTTPGAVHDLGVIAGGYGIGAAVPFVFLALGFDPTRPELSKCDGI